MSKIYPLFYPPQWEKMGEKHLAHFLCLMELFLKLHFFRIYWDKSSGSQIIVIRSFYPNKFGTNAVLRNYFLKHKNLTKCFSLIFSHWGRSKSGWISLILSFKFHSFFYSWYCFWKCAFFYALMRIGDSPCMQCDRKVGERILTKCLCLRK